MNLEPFRLCFDIYAGNSRYTDYGFYYISRTRNYNLQTGTESIDLSKWNVDSIRRAYILQSGLRQNVPFSFNSDEKIMLIIWNGITIPSKPSKFYIEFYSLSQQREKLLNEILENETSST